ATFLFAFTTLVSWCQYGTKATEYAFGTKASGIYKYIFIFMILQGSVMTSSLAWDISDTFNGLMMIPNLIGVLYLSPLIVRISKNYMQRKNGEDVEPLVSYQKG
ncbi:MAG: alanine:cation symporter family protein, partial [Erysipelotrichaceae bacterium]|nr:alanine:cation symporter family protein [Erysipelotrichaceae bacterium]